MGCFSLSGSLVEWVFLLVTFLGFPVIYGSFRSVGGVGRRRYPDRKVIPVDRLGNPVSFYGDDISEGELSDVSTVPLDLNDSGMLSESTIPDDAVHHPSVVVLSSDSERESVQQGPVVHWQHPDKHCPTSCVHAMGGRCPYVDLGVPVYGLYETSQGGLRIIGGRRSHPPARKRGMLFDRLFDDSMSQSFAQCCESVSLGGPFCRGSSSSGFELSDSSIGELLFLNSVSVFHLVVPALPSSFLISMGLF